MSIRRIVPDIASPDPAGGREFFTDVLGLEPVMDLGWVVTYASPSNITAQINIVRSQPGAPQPDYSVEVADIESCYARAVAKGQPIVYPLTTEPWNVRRFCVRDPHGKIVNVMTHVGALGR